MNDITKHEWSDIHPERVAIDHDGNIEIATKNLNYLTINKSDAIAIAQHFGLFDGIVVPKDSICYYKEFTFVVGDTVTGHLSNCTLVEDMGDNVRLVEQNNE
ncbi:hypothetical protein KAR91_46605 [Candidatus Pacearchaeota archaeon]|nr:hypothetical protein [Candidatus Pacearchaeota archaeon]